MPMVDGQPIQYEKCPAIHRESMKMYFEHRCDPGSGLRLILANELRAVVACDEETVRQLPAIWRWLYNYVPPIAWGSTEKVLGWLDGRNGALRPIINRVAHLTVPEFANNAATEEGL